MSQVEGPHRTLGELMLLPGPEHIAWTQNRNKNKITELSKAQNPESYTS